MTFWIIGEPFLEDFWKHRAKKLPYQDRVLRVSDFDYTLFARCEQLEKVPELKNHRWDKGPEYIFEKYGMEGFISEFYTWKSIPDEIASLLNSEHDVIITAWKSPDFQLAKVRSIKQLEGIQCIVTPDGLSKVPELIRYILFKLQYIPKEIIIYEDRPEYFDAHRKLIESILWTKVTIMYVQMDGNHGYKKIQAL